MDFKLDERFTDVTSDEMMSIEGGKGIFKKILRCLALPVLIIPTVIRDIKDMKEEKGKIDDPGERPVRPQNI